MTGRLTLVGLLGGSGGSTLNSLADLVTNAPVRLSVCCRRVKWGVATYLRVSIMKVEADGSVWC